MKAMDRLLHGHRQFSETWTGEQGPALQALADGQTPKAIVISCSDSRVVPEIILSAVPGMQLHARVYDIRKGEVRFWDQKRLGFHAGAGTGTIAVAEVKAQDNV